MTAWSTPFSSRSCFLPSTSLTQQSTKPAISLQSQPTAACIAGCIPFPSLILALDTTQTSVLIMAELHSWCIMRHNWNKQPSIPSHGAGGWEQRATWRRVCCSSVPLGTHEMNGQRQGKIQQALLMGCKGRAICRNTVSRKLERWPMMEARRGRVVCQPLGHLVGIMAVPA